MPDRRGWIGLPGGMSRRRWIVGPLLLVVATAFVAGLAVLAPAPADTTAQPDDSVRPSASDRQQIVALPMIPMLPRISPDPSASSDVPSASATTGSGPSDTEAPGPDAGSGPNAASDNPGGGVPVPGAAHYVAASGSDDGPGTLARPWRSPGHAAEAAPAGSTIYLRGGTYPGFAVTRSGLTFASYPGETATVSDPSRENVIEFDGVTGGVLRDLVVTGSATQYGSGVKIAESTGVSVVGSEVRQNRTWGIVVVRSSGVVLADNDIWGNANGVEERYADGLTITGNRIHDNTTMVDGGRGRQGINFYKSTGPITVAGNQLWNNGTHFEIYGASRLNIMGNATWSGQVMETGTDGPACDGNRFVRNVSYRGQGLDDRTNGLILRCASNMLVAHNTIHGFDQFAFDVVDGTQGVAYGGSIANLRIVNNILSGGRAYSIDNALPASVSIDYNLLYNVGSSAAYGNYLAYVAGVGNLKTLDALRAATGYDRHGRFGDPAFVNTASGDLRITAGSAAVDGGTVVLADGYRGSAPDIGRFELP
jgi:parallel beta helix pectate lyase-like protein